ncbi:sensor histidine kinase [Acinetobacter indicus]|uniref:sensor histidine kinase n=1 Tax=Acinetobacter indicus TaxID=756892 RepID=UPI001E39C4F6|nr:ATP-binding protein [Acinetobacter indicus]
MQREKRFTSNAAHELRTPLAAIRLHAQVLQNARSNEESKEAAQDIITGVDKASRMITQLLTLARLEPNATQNKSNIDLVDIVKGTVEMMGIQFRKAGVDLQLHLTSVCVWGQSDQLEIMLRNILENAILYRSSINKPMIKVSCGGIGNGSFTQVEDNGIGLDEAQIPFIFQRFYRINQASSVVGSGLGLSIVKQIIDSHLGKITLQRANAVGGLIVRIEFFKKLNIY